MASDPKFGQEPPTNDDGSYKDVLAQFGHFYLHPDGQTLENVKDGTTYDLTNIGSGGGGAFEDTDGDDIAELQTPHETHQGGDSRDIGGLSYAPTEVVAADSPYTTQGESVLYVDTTNGAVEIVLNSNDAVDGHTVQIYDVGENAGANNITISTEGSETINPGGQSSITISLNGGYGELINRAGNWFTDRHAQKDQAQTGEQSITTSVTYPSGATVTDNPSAVDWQVDANSPKTASGANNITYSINGTYDVVAIFAKATDTAGSSNNLDLQVNGDTGTNYTYRDVSGTQTTGASAFNAVAGMSSNATSILTTRLFAKTDGIGAMFYSQEGGGATASGQNTTVSHPATQFTLKRGAATDFSVEAYGRVIG